MAGSRFLGPFQAEIPGFCLFVFIEKIKPIYI